MQELNQCSSCGCAGHNIRTCGRLAADGATREQRRSRRKRAIRARTISVKRLTKRELDLGRLHYPDVGDHGLRPRTRGECAAVERPCPFVSCKYHLYLDVHPHTGAIKVNFPDLEPDELVETCALDVADRGGVPLDVAGEYANITRERIRQIETVAKTRLRRLPIVGQLWRDGAYEMPCHPLAAATEHRHADESALEGAVELAAE